MSWFKRAPEGAGEDAYLVEAIIGGEAVIVPVLGATSRRDALAICASEFSNAYQSVTVFDAYRA